MGKTKRVLVFGSSNSGKTSMCNALTNQNFPTGNDATGVTLRNTDYPPYYWGSTRYVFTDTIGLNECASGSVSADYALTTLLRLVQASKSGYHLLVFVMRCGTITDADQKVYDLIVNKVTEGRIPVLIVVTHCEFATQGESMQSWVDANHKHFENANMPAAEILGTCFKVCRNTLFMDLLNDLRQSSVAAVWEAVGRHCNPTVQKFVLGTDNDLLATIKRLWNSMCDTFHLDTLKIPTKTVLQYVQESLQQCPLPTELSLPPPADFRDAFSVDMSVDADLHPDFIISSVSR
eukprot:TRINITY_DN113500_c0_g1_i1.p1 TRINITY_DN113500_c0_g1~~TRINITY_DN113500_c0_g1_i1.p1  ORF type:complete len:307 (+),score=11.78 TRINITY_DN113500_c0_g1_i1:50-922(+)